MSDDLGRAAWEIRNGINAKLNQDLLKRVAETVANAVQEHRTPELENLRLDLERTGLKIPLLGCEAFTRHWEECSLLRHHEGECS